MNFALNDGLGMDGDLGGTRGDRPPQKVRWRGRNCFYPPDI